MSEVQLWLQLKASGKYQFCGISQIHTPSPSILQMYLIFSIYINGLTRVLYWYRLCASKNQDTLLGMIIMYKIVVTLLETK